MEFKKLANNTINFGINRIEIYTDTIDTENLLKFENDKNEH